MNKMTLCSFLTERPDIEMVKVKGRGRRSLESYVDYIYKNFSSIKNVVAVVDNEEITISRAIDSVPSMFAYAQR